MENLKLTAQVSLKKVFISEANGLKLWKQKNVTSWFYNCVINIFKNGDHIITSDSGKKYKIRLEEVFEPYDWRKKRNNDLY